MLDQPCLLLVDTAIIEHNGHDFGLTAKHLASAQDVLKALADETHGKDVLNRVWETNLRSLLDPTLRQEPSDALLVSEGRDPSGVGFTSLSCAHSKSKKAVSVHIVHNKHFDRTLIVTGEEVSPRLRAAFAKSRTVIVSQGEDNAAGKVAALLKEVVPSTLNRKRLSEAFSFRNDTHDTLVTPADARFEQLLVDKGIEQHLPKLVCKM